jgi:hypothetical protein
LHFAILDETTARFHHHIEDLGQQLGTVETLAVGGRRLGIGEIKQPTAQLNGSQKIFSFVESEQIRAARFCGLPCHTAFSS